MLRFAQSFPQLKAAQGLASHMPAVKTPALAICVSSVSTLVLVGSHLGTGALSVLDSYATPCTAGRAHANEWVAQVLWCPSLCWCRRCSGGGDGVVVVVVVVVHVVVVV